MLRFLIVLLCTPIGCGCAAWSGPPKLPDRARVMREQLEIYSDFALPQHHRLIEDLAALRRDMGLKLELPTSDEPIYVYLFDQETVYSSFMTAHYPEFPDRRAFFIDSDTQLTVYAYWGDRVAEDLRHELAHGYLHAVTPNVPLWLDEGIAEYYEVPRGQRGKHSTHLALLAKHLKLGSWRPDLRRLETLEDVSQMSQADYAEAWLWTHFLLETTRDRSVMLQAFLAELRRSGTASPLSQVLYNAESLPEEKLVKHLDWLSAP